MDQKKIGLFIAKCRKEKKMTQVELAEKLGVTDKSISNWENARCMPDLSLFKPLCDALDITINELLSGEKIEKEFYQEKFEENMINTIDYTNKKINLKNRHIGFILFIIGILIMLNVTSILPSESRWCPLYSFIGIIISLAGLFVFLKKMNIKKRVFMAIGYIVLCVAILLSIDYINVVKYHHIPRFSYDIETMDKMIIYKAPFYNVYRINQNTRNEYYIIDTKKQYTKTSVAITPFNREKSGFKNIVQYKNKYIGNNSNTGNLIGSLPLSEYGFVFEIDSKNLTLTIDYHITDWYINEDLYLEKSLLYNAVSIFSLIDNVEYIHFHFSGNSYTLDRNEIKLYPNYNKIEQEDSFNQYVEKKMNDDVFVKQTFQKIFHQ